MLTMKEKLFPASGPRLERLPAVLARTGLSRSTIYKKIADGEFPKPVLLGKRAVAWRSSVVSEWINARLVADGTS
jgi:prophage regulatory protein